MGKARNFESEGSVAAKSIINNRKFQNIATNVNELYGESNPGQPSKGNTPLNDKSKLSKLGGKMQGSIAFSHNVVPISSGTASLDNNNGTLSSPKSYISLVPQGLVNDTLDNITGRKYEGQLLIINNSTSGTAITLTDGAGGVGGMACPDSTDYVLTYPNSVILIDDPEFGTQTWRVIGPAPAAGSGINNIVEDTTPQLGGDLDLNGNSIDMAESERLYFAADKDTYMTGSVTSGRINVFNNNVNVTSFLTSGLLTTNITCASISTTGDIDLNSNDLIDTGKILFGSTGLPSTTDVGMTSLSGSLYSNVLASDSHYFEVNGEGTVRIHDEGLEILEGDDNRAWLTIRESTSIPTTANATGVDAIIYAVDDGGGKTILKVQFNTGTPITIATEA